MTDEELREAVKYFKSSVKNKSLTQANINMSILITLAECYLSMSEKCPKEKRGEGVAEEQPFLFGQVIGYNKAREDMLLWFMKALPSEEEINQIIVDGILEEKSTNETAKKILDLIKEMEQEG